MALRVKSFRISNESDETEMNTFLEGKVVRQWSANFSGDPTIWNVLIAYDNAREERPAERNDRNSERGGDRMDRGNDRNKKNDRGNDRNQRDDRGPRNDRMGSDRGNGAPHAEARPPKEKREREPQVIDVPESDMPLYEAVRKWRNARAREADVKPFQLFNNKQLEALVKSKPQSGDSLKAILTDMDASQFDRYQHELLGFIQGATTEPTSV